MNRRCFDHLVVELSVAVGRLVPRYPLWLRVQELGWDPESWTTSDVMRFFDEHLDDFLREYEVPLSARAHRRLRTRVRRFDPGVPTPYETMERIFGQPR